MTPYYEHAGITIYHASALTVLDEWEGVRAQSFDLLLTDPPYGLNEAAGKNKSRSNVAVAQDYGVAMWDARPAHEAIAMARRFCRHQIVFGGNYYDLGPARCMLVWDKDNGQNDFADCELAWTNLGNDIPDSTESRLNCRGQGGVLSLGLALLLGALALCWLVVFAARQHGIQAPLPITQRISEIHLKVMDGRALKGVSVPDFKGQEEDDRLIPFPKIESFSRQGRKTHDWVHPRRVRTYADGADRLGWNRLRPPLAVKSVFHQFVLLNDRHIHLSGKAESAPHNADLSLSSASQSIHDVRLMFRDRRRSQCSSAEITAICERQGLHSRIGLTTRLTESPSSEPSSDRSEHDKRPAGPRLRSKALEPVIRFIIGPLLLCCGLLFTERGEFIGNRRQLLAGIVGILFGVILLAGPWRLYL